jgi:hypothetical protein
LGHWDGATWQWAEAAGTWSLWAIWGANSHDVWTGGSKVGGAGYVARGDGIRFDAAAYSGDAARGIWGSAQDDVWVATYDGEFQRWNGSRWEAVKKAHTAAITDISGTSRDDVWSVGLDGLTLHWDGSSWQTVESGTHKNLSSVWAISADDLWASGEDGVLLHWDGTRWSS